MPSINFIRETGQTLSICRKNTDDLILGVGSKCDRSTEEANGARVKDFAIDGGRSRGGIVQYNRRFANRAMATGSVQPLPPALPPPAPPQPITAPYGFFGSCTSLRGGFTGDGGAGPTARPSPETPGPGLDPVLVRSFPTFAYSTVEGFQKEKYGLECAICLVEFQGDDVLRLLTTCYHVFHEECVDLWLGGHRTCPVCRRNLDSPGTQSPVMSPSRGDEATGVGSESYTITIKEGDEEDKGESGDVKKTVRSHSTGHSLGADLDRYTLVLPEHVRLSIIRGHHNPSHSWPTFENSNDTRDSNGVGDRIPTRLDGGDGGENKE
ncbi:RING/U-box superfamily protein [Striga asiatica]|uniref:RING-type E3 ubiquitin transferase n=1 Tax=Striga asiatica TaxID=4170 RepID=A0A5A7QZN0_STRAF|nr:RING/U-box superfamily protein [Striga asiatica]